MTSAVNGYKYNRQTLLGLNVPQNLPQISNELRKNLRDFKALAASSQEPVSNTAVKVAAVLRAHL